MIRFVPGEIMITHPLSVNINLWNEVSLPYFLHLKRRRIEGGKGRESVVSYIVSSDYDLKLGQIRLATRDLQSISQGFPKGKSDKKKG